MAINFTVTFKKDVHKFTLDPTVTVHELKNQLHALTGVDPSLQKLISKGQMRDEMQLADVPVVSGAKIMLIGSPQTDVDKMKVPKLPPQQLASRPVAVSRRAGGIATIDTIGADTLFGMIKVLDGWPNSEQARQILLRLSTDNSIVQVMKKHNWKVGVLSELTPLEHTKLGYNMNRGAEISLRLRFEDGFRQYDSIKKVLYHELAHLEVDEHNDDFKALNSQIKRECESVGPGRKLGEGNSYYNGPSSSDEDEELEAVDHGGIGYRLGGDESTSSDTPLLTPTQAAAQAALRRLGSAPKPTPLPSTSSTSTSSTPTSRTTPTIPPSPSTSEKKPTTTPTTTSTPATTSPISPSSSTSPSTIPSVLTNTTTKIVEPNIINETGDGRTCPICGLEFQAATTDRQVTQHVNSCLDKA